MSSSPVKPKQAEKMKLIIREIISWLNKNSNCGMGYPFPAYQTNYITPKDDCRVGLCHTGVIMTYGANSFERDWYQFTVKELQLFFAAAKKKREKEKKANEAKRLAGSRSKD